jgi:hypothetical protein
MRPGNGALRFKANVPASVKLQIAEWLPETGPGASVVVTPTPIDPDAIGDAAALGVAIYRGRIDNRPSQFDLEVRFIGATPSPAIRQRTRSGGSRDRSGIQQKTGASAYRSSGFSMSTTALEHFAQICSR